MEFKCPRCNNDTGLFVKQTNNSTGLFCTCSGKWIKWLSKEEVRVYNQLYCKNQTENNSAIINNSSEQLTKEELKEYIQYIDNVIDQKIIDANKNSLNHTEKIRLDSYCLALEKVKTGLENIVNGLKYNYKLRL